MEVESPMDFTYFKYCKVCIIDQLFVNIKACVCQKRLHKVRCQIAYSHHLFVSLVMILTLSLLNKDSDIDLGVGVGSSFHVDAPLYMTMKHRVVTKCSVPQISSSLVSCITTMCRFVLLSKMFSDRLEGITGQG